MGSPAMSTTVITIPSPVMKLMIILIIAITDDPDNDNDKRLSLMGSKNKFGLSIMGISNYLR